MFIENESRDLLINVDKINYFKKSCVNNAANSKAEWSVIAFTDFEGPKDIFTKRDEQEIEQIWSNLNTALKAVHE